MSEDGAWRNARVFGRPWQDLLFAVGEIVFLAALLPILFDDNSRVPFWSGFGSAVMLYAFTIAQISYRNWITVFLTFWCATIWLLIGIGVHF